MLTHAYDSHGRSVALSDVVNELLQTHAPAEVRKILSTRGIRWRYAWSGVPADSRVGVRERERRLKRLGLQRCHGCDQGFSIFEDGDTCPECLIEKWTGTRPLTPGVILTDAR